ncbi:LLM class F420-dependent oxidoreductase [Mycobacterium sp. CBMA 234]|uniref:TIGR03617 family F420-dependent LLM class oxidoreductase n=1 Tax=Mycolicibacterium sp. CBMA 234 TaxID=1918495 RepID=UPI0012DCF138|nr:TIGR03617 family F420-dependent LLM class oxidoreductase [Mycolicibacterium sp. CBMA 234]MUL66804.1 LLM class F420-dependent oxidoreductase [Mycolicibacterium sp. CBMA 234]
MQVFAAMSPEMPLTQVAAYARRVEKLGFDGLHIAETTHDSLAVSLLAAEHTERIVIRTAVTLAFVRSPMLTAYAAWDLQTFSGGRFELGLGSQIRQNIEDRFGMPWSEPCARMAEYVSALTAIFEAFRTGGSVRHEGDAYRITRLQPYFNPGPNDIEPPQIWLGAVNARMCEVAGGVADGVVTHSTNSDPGYLRDVVRPALERGAEAAGRTGLPQLVASTAVATGSTDLLVSRERERQRRMLAFLLSTPAYAATLKRHGWTDLADGLRTLIKQQRWDDLPTVLDDTVLDQLVTAGRYDQLADLLRAKYDGIVDGVVLPPVSDDEGEDQPVQACIRNLHGGDGKGA